MTTHIEAMKMALDAIRSTVAYKQGAVMLNEAAEALTEALAQPAAGVEPAPSAMQNLTHALKEDADHAWSWHCNLAVMAIDAGADHRRANERAASLMMNLFGVDTRNNEHYKTLFDYDLDTYLKKMGI